MFAWVLVLVGVMVALWGSWHVLASICDWGLPEKKWRRFLVWHGHKAARLYASASGILMIALGLFMVLLGLFGHEREASRGLCPFVPPP